MSCFVYILQCSNGHYYTGFTVDIHRRMREHWQGSARCKYTRSFPPQAISACWLLDLSKSAAMQLESKIKTLNRTQKQSLISQPNQLLEIMLLPPQWHTHIQSYSALELVELQPA